MDDIKHEAHPVGRYLERGKPPRIEFSRRECARLSDDDLRFAVYHEVGHWWRTTYVPKEVLSTYGREPEERFANAFASYLIEENPDDDIVDHFEDMAKQLTGHEDEVCEFAERVLEELRLGLDLPDEPRETTLIGIGSKRQVG